VIDKYGSYANYTEQSGGPSLTDPETLEMATAYLDELKLADVVSINIDPNLVAHASITISRGKPTLNLRPGMRRNWIGGTLHHEIGTHLLRDLNNSRQPWAGKANRRRYRMDDKNPTEEGLACLHTVLERDGHALWRPALMYYAVMKAEELSFAELFADLGKFLDCSEDRWDYCLRVKRGLTDTSEHAAFAKDQMYLIGALEILAQRHTIDFPSLYMGKVSFRDALSSEQRVLHSCMA